MQYVVDLHLHSKYSRAVSPQMTLPMMDKLARQKGLDILSSADFTHPVWFKETQTLLEESGEGVYKLRTEIRPACRQGRERRTTKDTLFVLSTEISSIYKQGDKLRRIHNLIFVPNLAIAQRLTQELIKRGCNLNADGRPIVGLSSKDLLELILSLDERCMLLPCHIWTPHFGIYGSASGFDSLAEAFGDLSPYIYGIETGLSSDPDMNWQVPELMYRSILSFSDAHSAPKMSREATVMELEQPTYENIRKAIMRLSVIASRRRGNLNQNGIDGNRIAYTLEFYPEEGKYHFSGHRNCNVVYTPEDIRARGTVCPVCGRGLTEGVFMRVEQLSDPKLFGRAVPSFDEHGVKWYTDKLKIQPPYVKLVPLLEIVAESLHSTVASQKSQQLFAKLCSEFESELTVLLKTDLADIEHLAGWKLAESIQKVRKGDIAIDPGFDGVFGKVAIWREEEEKQKAEEKAPQLRLAL